MYFNTNNYFFWESYFSWRLLEAKNSPMKILWGCVIQQLIPYLRKLCGREDFLIPLRSQKLALFWILPGQLAFQNKSKSNAVLGKFHQIDIIKRHWISISISENKTVLRCNLIFFLTSFCYPMTLTLSVTCNYLDTN